MKLGVYIHFPYCRKKCPYCDFAVAVRREIPHERYAAAVRRELRARARDFAGRRLVSIYFGGGTPGLWQASCVGEVIAAVREAFAAPHELEITVEADPDLLPGDHLVALGAAGVNRLSLGVQSLAPRHLVTLGRLHGPAEPPQAVARARAAGFANLSLDLMFGLPTQTMEELERDLGGLLALGPEHLSIYGLTIEDRTPFGALHRQGQLTLPDTDLQAEMYQRIGARAAAAGFLHYEISSYARPGFAAVHNTLYWSGGEWLGLGSAAHSFRYLPDGGGERRANVRSVDAYLTRCEALDAGSGAEAEGLVASREHLDADTLGREAMWLGLRRLSEGVDRAAYVARHGADPTLRFAAQMTRLHAAGLVEVSPERIRLTPRGVLLADEVGAYFI
jgi:oxygen-independent coproporphyrinogen-3 oxidase